MKVQNPIIGRARGSAGGMTFCKNYDKNVARAKAFEVSNPNTPAQQNQRSYFTQLSSLVATITDEQLRTLFPQKPKSMSRRNALSKQIGASKTTVGDAKVIDFADILTLGNASTMDFGTTTCVYDSGNPKVTLDNAVKGNTVVSGNLFTAAIINETKGEILLAPNCALVSTGVLTVTNPTGWVNTDTIHAVPLILNSKDGEIVLVGFGSMIVVERPAR